ncbi:MAG: hypothetical protein ACRBN8_40115 [Nannocystales bacterium]
MRRLTVRRQGQAVRLREDLLHHLWVEFPQHCVLLTDPQTRRFVETAIARAAHHGVTEFAAVAVYTTLMVFLGHRFDEDPLLPWASETLKKNRPLPQKQAMSRLQARAADELAKSVGDDGEHYRRAMLWARSKSFATLSTDYVGRGDQGLHDFVRDLLPPRYAELGAERVTELHQRARTAAEHFGVAGPEGTLVVTALMILLGTGFADDPFHPWTQPALKESRDTDVPAERFHSCALRELERHLSLDRITAAHSRRT